MELPVGEPDPVTRLERIVAAMQAHKSSGQAIGATALVGLVGLTPPTLHSLGAKLSSSLSSRMFNVVVTNVPGPQFPLYAMGARMRAMYPVVPLAKGQAVSIGITSYDGGVFYGLNADRDAMVDVDVLAASIGESLVELRGTVSSSPRVGLVLGAGGVLGSAWMVGALAALETRLDRTLGELDLVLGTSAGSVLGAALRCGMGVDELITHQSGADAVDRLPDVRTIERESGDGRPPVPLPWIGSPRLLAAAAVAPCRVPPLVAATALLPVGRARMGALIRLVDSLQERIGVTTDRWVPGSPLWVVAVDYDSGRRVVFGREGAPPSSVADAVLASCAIPGWFTPQIIDGHRYIDGGVASTTSLGLLAREGAPELDEVYVLAPLASRAYDHPLDPVASVERGVRRVVSRWLDREVRAVRATGTRVTVLTPGPRDLTAMGGNLMNPRRRARVLETSLETSAATLTAALSEGSAAA